MKALLKLVNARQDKVFQVMKVSESYFYPHWHFHPECEIMLVLEGTGMRFAGDSMQRFRPGDLVLFSNKLPHLYRSDKVYYEKDSGFLSKAFVVYFDEALLRGDFWTELNSVALKKLFALSKRGIKFTGKSRNKIRSQLLELDESKDSLEKMIDLLSLLKTMSEATEYEQLSSDGFTNVVVEDDCQRINNVYQFVMDNYTRNPSLEDVAKIACMSPTAFCRFFKSQTNKTYIQFLNEVKIGNACNLLINHDLSISQVCFMAGFNNTAHFNNQFRKILGVTPSEYREEHVEFVPS
jgi:AraC-like DNA-binding protein